jgi:hypothetical protein
VVRASSLSLLCVAACSFDPSGPGAANDTDGGDALDSAITTNDSGQPAGDGMTTSADAATVATGCIPASWTATFTDTFDGALGSWDIDGNATSMETNWTVSNGSLTGHSTSAGTDVAVSGLDIGDSAVAVTMRVDPLGGATGYRAGGPLLRATDIDFASNYFYACFLDPGQQLLILARYDIDTQIGSGQGFTLIDQGSTGAVSGDLLVTMCADGTTISCEAPSLGLQLSGSDSLYASGQPGLRIMRADLIVDQFTVYQP